MKLVTYSAIFLMLIGVSFAQSPEMVLVEGGSFRMGNDYSSNQDERPERVVKLNSFYMSKYEVTNAEYRIFAKAVGIDRPIGPDNSPVTNLSWQSAVMFCNWLSGKENLDQSYQITRDSNKFIATFIPGKSGYRLPTEAEWEYAARGGSKSKYYAYSGSNDPGEVSWNITNSGNATHEVGSKKPNELGIFDMTGNTMEWCTDWFDDKYYGKNENENPYGPLNGVSRVCRGGNYLCRSDVLRNTRRFELEPNNTDGLAGIRLVKNQ